MPALDVTVRLLQGKTLREEILEPNPMDENLVNTIMLDPPYVITREVEEDAPWMEGLTGTQAISCLLYTSTQTGSFTLTEGIDFSAEKDTYIKTMKNKYEIFMKPSVFSNLCIE